MKHTFSRPMNLIAALLLCALGCGTPGKTPPKRSADAGMEATDGGASPDLADPGSGYQTPFPPVLPQVVKGSGSVLTGPTVVPVFFPQDGLQSSIETFLQDFVARSAAWKVVQEYGVGKATIAPSVVMSKAPPAAVADADVQALVAAQVQAGIPSQPGQAIYVVFYPYGVTITKDSSKSCQDFGGYHDSAVLQDGSHAAYAVVPRCSRSVLSEVTGALSHEMAESATDPLTTANNQLGQPYGLWLVNLHGAEIGDLCQNLLDPVYNEAGVGVVSRLWSNVSAAARQNPCQPAPAGPSFFSVPILTERPRVTILNVAQNIESVPVAVGQTGTIEVRLASDTNPSPTWVVSAVEVPLFNASGGMNAPVLSLSWQESPGRPRVSGQDGTVLHLQIAVDAGASAGYTTVRIISIGPTQSGAQTETDWVATVRITG